ncbi:hypothetical protein F2Q65_16335 [Thiohalocapsa marina]|uniref:Transposase IS801/IS1294 domain-containing protein n=2 Tax=Thiohalocapsa marina TaxID=424902 RepID=A0A5M8FEE6_9GAMM|nr:hypothetical protein F2Q65_16335 [Thiohalocapsa marina]
MPRCAWARTIALGPIRSRERLLRYCARPTFALERLELLDAERVVYRLPKPQRDGTTALMLTPLALIDQLAARVVHRLAATATATTVCSPPTRPCVRRLSSPAESGAETPRSAAVRHDPEPAPARRFGLQQASREVDSWISYPSYP